MPPIGSASSVFCETVPPGRGTRPSLLPYRIQRHVSQPIDPLHPGQARLTFSWFASLHSITQPLEFSQGEYDQTWTNHLVPRSASRARYEESSLFVQLTLLENDVVARATLPDRAAHQSLISLEERMHHWMKELREYEKQDGGMSGFANIRFHW
jgi:hypothetical protein